MTEAEIRADERAKCVAELRRMNRERIGYEWLWNSVWANIIERCASALESQKHGAVLK